MQEFLGAVIILAGFVCAVHFGLGLNGREVPAGECLRFVAFLVMLVFLLSAERLSEDVD
jgi:hypothetical protein